MPRLMMFITQKISSALKGQLTRWMLQLKPGVFIGTLSTLVGEKLWKKIIEGQGKGGAIWVKATNTEQRFELSISGDTHWILQEFDGLQLITHPHKKSEQITMKKKDINAESFNKSNKTIKNTKIVPKITWDKDGLPNNLIVRRVSCKMDKGKIKTTFSGTSAYEEYPPHTLWRSPYKEEIQMIVESLLKFLGTNLNSLSSSFFDKTINSIDIETTDYIPKALEGFINIIGIASLDLTKIQHQIIRLDMTQIFNMTRKRAEVPYLLSFILPLLMNSNVLLVFNKEFDIKILSRVIQEDSLNLSLPTKIIDLQENFLNLKSLEQYLFSKAGIRRIITEKGKFGEYYTLFKGQGVHGYHKQIEPIGTYNLTDVLTPLYTYFVINIEKNNKNLK